MIGHYERIFLLEKMCFTGDDGYKNFLVFASMLSSLRADNNKKSY